MRCLDLRKSGWREMTIALNRKSQRPSRGGQFGEPEVAELVFKPNHPAEEQVFPVELEGIPCPEAIRREELADHEGVFHLFLRIEQWKVFSYLVWQQFYTLPLFLSKKQPTSTPYQNQERDTFTVSLSEYTAT